MKTNTLFTLFTVLFIGINGFSQQCDTLVPLYSIDLSSTPDTTWVLYEEDALDRNGQCCNADPNENCIEFEITLNQNTAGVFFDYDGAGAYGSLNWQIDCGPEYNLKDTICITGGGTFTLTFCKPGSDNGNYTLISVAKPTFPEDQFVPLNCSQPVEALGVTDNTIVWQSISPGAPGDYDALLSCTNCLDPVYTPDPLGPVEVEYQVCGYPILDYCVGNFDFCDTVKFTSLDSILVDITPANPSFCSGGNVTLTANATGGDNNFNYIWYDAMLSVIGTGPTLLVDSAGVYTVEAQEGNFQVGYCDNFSQSISVVETSPPDVDAGADQVLCADVPEASLSASVQYATGGIWSGGAGVYSPSTTDLSITYTPTQAEIASGSVTLSFTSTGAGSSCTNMSDDIQLFFLDTIQTDLSDMTLNCFGSTTAINPTVSGGLAPFEYSWTNGVTTLNNNLGVGTHCLTINDDNGCQTTECFTITSPTELNLTMSSTPVSVNGGSDGTVTASPSGGTMPYTYLWNTTGTNSTETGLPYGVYTVTVTDDNDCVYDGSVVVNDPQCSGFSLTTSATNVNCFGDSTGSVSVTTSGGTAPFTYAWNDYAMQTTSNATSLPQGVYEVVVTDDNGCVSIQTATINEPSAITNTITHVDATTQGGSDGSAQANVIGGSGSYSYLWSTTETTSGISGLVTDWYNLTVTDGNGCTLDDSVFINEPPCDQFLLYVSTTSPLCNGDVTGTADLTIMNGVGPFSITWSTGETDVLSIANAPGGIHNVEVTDAQGCYTSLNYGISEPSPLSIGLSGTPSSCAGSDNGTIDMTVTGGTYPYSSFSWSNGSETEDIINLEPNSYAVTVIDQNGCSASSFTELVDPAPLSLTYTVQNVTCFEGTDGAIDITPSGGTGTYSFDWSNGATTEDLSNIDVGGYILNIMDGNFCDFDDPITIYVEEPEQVIVDSISVHCPLPGANMANVEIFPYGGNSDYTISFDGGQNYLPAGTYENMVTTGNAYDVMIMDVNGCLSPIETVAIDPTLVIDSVAFNTCYSFGQTDELVQVYAQGGSPDYFISFDNGTTFGSAGVYSSNLPINSSYDVLAQDQNGCISAVTPILLPDSMMLTCAITDALCYDDSNGSIDITLTGGSAPYTYAWSNGSSLEDIDGLAEGSYTVDILDANNCPQQGTYMVYDPDSLSVELTSPMNFHDHNIDLFGGSDGEIDATVIGGTMPYDYSWLNGETSEDLFGLTAGTYELEVMDYNGCMASAMIVLTEPFDLQLPTAFSPNNDLSNDIYDIHGIEAYPDNEFIVHNRWGNVVFETTGYHNVTNNWSGEHKNGEMLPDGVYFVIVEINGGEIKRNTYVHIKTH